MGFISPVATDTNGNVKDTGGLQSLGKDDFLQLLVTKLQHQDPLDPQSDEDFIAQLAQFSSLEQMNNVAEGIAESNNLDYLQMQSLNNMMASGLVGTEVSADYSGIYLESGDTANIAYTLNNFASEVKFTIYDASGNAVTTLTANDVALGVHAIEWDGTDTLGNRMDEGYYTVEATAIDGDGTESTPELGLTGIVQKIFYRDGAAYLLVDDTEVSLGDIRSVGTPTVEEEEEP